MPRQPRPAILFDLDDTLFDHAHSSECALRDVCERHAALRTVAFEELRQVSSQILEDLHPRLLRGELSAGQARRLRFQRLFSAVGEAIDDETAMEVAREYRVHYERTWRPVEGACALIAGLEPHAAIGIVTNNLLAEQVEKLRACGLTASVGALVASEEAGVAKPDPAIFGLALARLQCEPAHAVMVGDSWTMDVLGAHAAGLTAVWFNRLGRACPDPALAHVVASYAPAGEVAHRLLSLARQGAGQGTEAPGRSPGG